MEQQAGLVNGAIQENGGFDATSVAHRNDNSEPTRFNKTLPVTSVLNENPVTASDDDLIEKEWVERAKKIVDETRDNPYRQDDEVNKLQADYVSKRYSKKLGSS